ncbi:bactofilin family protein [Hydrogenimonas sp.]
MIAPGTRVQGSLFSEGGVHIGGEVEGDVIAKSYVIVTPGAVVHGKIEARDVYVGGTVHGDIWAIELELYGSAECNGEIEAIRITKDETNGV